MVSDGDIVYDILQEVFIYYYKKLENGVEIKYPKTWLVRATINKCFDHLKYKAKHRKIEDIAPIAISDDCSEQDQKRMILNHALSKLKDKEKTLVLLYGEGMSYKEISKVTGINETSVGKTLSRSLKKFETILKSIDHEMY
jgi:RNA polymerase sigma-70 factor (ECF subfamily)